MFDSACVLHHLQRNSLDAFHVNFKSCTLFRLPNHFQLSLAFISKHSNSRGHVWLQNCLIWMFLISTTSQTISNDMQKSKLLHTCIGFFVTFSRLCQQRQKRAFFYLIRSNKMSGETQASRRLSVRTVICHGNGGSWSTPASPALDFISLLSILMLSLLPYLSFLPH